MPESTRDNLSAFATITRRAIPRLTAAAALMLGASPALAQIPSSRPADKAGAAGLLGRYSSTISGLRGPCSAAIDQRGHIYLAERDAARISVFDRTGRTILTFGERGTAAGQFLEPTAIALTPSGTVCVADNRLNRISLFDAGGRFLSNFGTFGTEDGELICPGGLSASDDRIVVADTGNSRIQVFALDGRALSSTGAFGAGTGQFRSPSGVSSMASGIIAVDRDLDRLAILNGDGQWLSSFCVTGPFVGMLLEPAGLAARGGHFFIAERLNHRVQVFDANGSPAWQWGLHAYRPREGEGRLHYPSAVAIAPDGSFAVVCEPFEDRVQIFDRMPPGQKPPQNPFIGLDPSGGSHFTPWADVGGRFLVTGELETDKIAIYDASREEPVMISTIGQRGMAPGQFIRPAGARLDVERSVLYVSDAGNRRLCEFALKLPEPGDLSFVPDMARLKRVVKFDALRASDKRLARLPVFEPAAIALGPDGIFVSDLRTGAVLTFDASLNLKGVWLDEKAAAEGPRCLVDIVLSADGATLLAADAAHGRVIGLTLGGETRFIWNLNHGEAHARPMGICVLSGGGVLVSDAAADRIIELDGEGALVRGWSKPGLGPGELRRPGAIRRLGDRELIAIDYGNHRGAIFDVNGAFRRVFGSRLFTAPARRTGRRSEQP